ncbi:hypothetical protein JY97_16405 [Alkalispirochaeta odontotermitis]|nr:hypothetical protein JY97_16405 [Alkalispirochaeta odontotermitis]
MAAGPGIGAGAGETTVPGAACGGPGKDTKLTLIAPCPNLGRLLDSGIKATDPMKIKWITSEIPK